MPSNNYSNLSKAMKGVQWNFSKRRNLIFDRLWREKFKKIPSVSISIPKDKLIVGSYTELTVKVSGIAFEEIGFKIPEGSKAGQISLSRENGSSTVNTMIMLLAGYEAGDYKLEAYKKLDNTVLATVEFSTTSSWGIEEYGPSMHLEGRITHEFTSGGAWGGGSPGVQNYNQTPHSGNWKVCLIMVDCAEERFPVGEVNTIRDRWMNETVNGFTMPDGSIRSAKKYYSEISNNTFNLQADIFGPVNLSGNFSDRINDDGSAKGSFAQEVVTSIDPSVDFSQYNTIAFVFRSILNAPAPATPKRCWAWGWGQSFATAEGNMNKACLIMPHDFDMHPSAGGRQIHETLSHELGHNFGMGDLYTPGVTGLNMGNWEPMANEGNLPSLSLYHLLRQGWVKDTWVKSYDFINTVTPIDETITLHPVEAGEPPVGRKSGIEIRITDGWNYYFEYKKGMTGEINSQNLPENRRVIGTDGITGLFVPPFERPGLLFLANDADGDGQILGNTEDYEEVDFSDPTFPTDFKVSVTSEDGNKAEVRVQYGVNSKPDPSIRKWPASPTRQWQSPDIEIRNARSMANPAMWNNVPWVNNDNIVVAKIKNVGTISAPQVRVNFYVRNYNIGGAPEVPIGSVIVDVPAGATIEAINPNPWRPPATGHYCIVARIPLYQLPSGGTVEMTELNNEAQSNYDRFVSGTASPYSREVTYLEVGNPYDNCEARIFVIPTQDSYHYRTYLEHTWVYLKPKEVKKIKVMTERIDNIDLPLDLPIYKKMLEGFNQPNIQGGHEKNHPLRVKNPVSNVSVMALVSEGITDQVHNNIIPLGGVDFSVVSGRKTEFVGIDQDNEMIYGQVVVLGIQEGVIGGTVLVKFVHKETIKDVFGQEQPEFSYQQIKVIENGYFRDKLKYRGDIISLSCYYDPSEGYTDCYSQEFGIR